MAAISYRERARAHFAAAKALLESGSDAELLYACLRLRLTIEALAYELLQLYRQDLPEETVRLWQVNKVLRELVALDPSAEATVSIEIGPMPGDVGPTITFEDHRMASDWAEKTYFTLGKFLHEQTLLDLERRGDLDRDNVRGFAQATLAKLGLVVNSSGWNMRVTFDREVECDCGTTLVFTLTRTQIAARTQCKVCNAQYEARIASASPSGERTFEVWTLRTGSTASA